MVESIGRFFNSPMEGYQKPKANAGYVLGWGLPLAWWYLTRDPNIPTTFEQGMIFLTTIVTVPALGQFTPALYRVALRRAQQTDARAKVEELANPQIYDPKKGNLKNVLHLLLMWTPNILNPSKAFSNLRNPVGEVIHTKHSQYLVEENNPSKDIYVVEHLLRGKLVTVDLVRRDRFPKPWLLRLKQLFEKDFYYGHAQYFPQPFRLIDRTFVSEEPFDIKEYAKKVLTKNGI